MLFLKQYSHKGHGKPGWAASGLTKPQLLTTGTGFHNRLPRRTPPLPSPRGFSASHRIRAGFGLEGTLELIWFQPPCHEQGPPPPAAPAAQPTKLLFAFRYFGFFPPKLLQSWVQPGRATGRWLPMACAAPARGRAEGQPQIFPPGSNFPPLCGFFAASAPAGRRGRSHPPPCRDWDAQFDICNPKVWKTPLFLGHRTPSLEPVTAPVGSGRRSLRSALRRCPAFPAPFGLPNRNPPDPCPRQLPALPPTPRRSAQRSPPQSTPRNPYSHAKRENLQLGKNWAFSSPRRCLRGDFPAVPSLPPRSRLVFGARAGPPRHPTSCRQPCGSSTLPPAPKRKATSAARALPSPGDARRDPAADPPAPARDPRGFGAHSPAAPQLAGVGAGRLRGSPCAGRDGAGSRELPPTGILARSR